MCRSLIGEHIRNDITLDHLRQDIGTVADQTDRDGSPLFPRFVDYSERLIERARHLVTITSRQAFFDPGAIDFYAKKKRTVHRSRKWLGPAHASKSTRHDKFSLERSAKMLTASFCKGFKCSLHDPLA